MLTHSLRCGLQIFRWLCQLLVVRYRMKSILLFVAAASITLPAQTMLAIRDAPAPKATTATGQNQELQRAVLKLQRKAPRKLTGSPLQKSGATRSKATSGSTCISDWFMRFDSTPHRRRHSPPMTSRSGTKSSRHTARFSAIETRSSMRSSSN
jgi:hypothetical protein